MRTVFAASSYASTAMFFTNREPHYVRRRLSPWLVNPSSEDTS
jgi:hypothetical protein